MFDFALELKNYNIIIKRNIYLILINIIGKFKKFNEFIIEIFHFKYK